MNLNIKITKTNTGHYLETEYNGCKYGQAYSQDITLDIAKRDFDNYVYFLDRGEFWQVTGPAWMVS